MTPSLNHVLKATSTEDLLHELHSRTNGQTKELEETEEVKLISFTTGVDGNSTQELIAFTARVSNPDNQHNSATAPRLLKYLAKHKHWSPFEMAHMTVEISTSRGLSPQILRHRSFSFQEFSQRYQSLDSSGVCVYAARRQDEKNRQNSIDDLPQEVQVEWQKRQLLNWQSAFEHYKWALDNGIAKECARFVLPLGAKTRLFMVGSVRSWIHYLQVRCDPSTQLEHRLIAEKCKGIFTELLPDIAKALEW